MARNCKFLLLNHLHCQDSLSLSLFLSPSIPSSPRPIIKKGTIFKFELERLRWRLRPGDLDLDRRRTGDLRLGDRDLAEKDEERGDLRHMGGGGSILRGGLKRLGGGLGRGATSSGFSNST
uniref:Uncharacterized protein n=1 Tax=Anser brachyrhynchus TaxID=132585 RepID=A0A8B9BHQ6_9AVES